MKASRAAIELIKRFESLQLDAYLCPAGVWTIGWGHTAGVEPGMRITAQHAEELLGLDIEEVERGPRIGDSCAADPGADRRAGVAGASTQRGPRQLPKVAPKLVAKINSGDYPRRPLNSWT